MPRLLFLSHTHTVCLSVCRSVGLSVCLLVGRSVGRSVCLSVGWLVGWSVGRSVCLSVCLSICLSLSLSLSFSFPIASSPLASSARMPKDQAMTTLGGPIALMKARKASQSFAKLRKGVPGISFGLDFKAHSSKIFEYCAREVGSESKPPVCRILQQVVVLTVLEPSFVTSRSLGGCLTPSVILGVSQTPCSPCQKSHTVGRLPLLTTC